MAVTNSETVVTATAANDTIGNISVRGIKVVGGAGGMTVKLRADQSASGAILYECTVGNSTEIYEDVAFNSRGGLLVDITAGSGTIYLYRDTE